MSVDEFVMTTDQLDDCALVQLGYIHAVLANDAGLSAPVRGWHASLVNGIFKVMAARGDVLAALEVDLASPAGMGTPDAPTEPEESAQ